MNDTDTDALYLRAVELRNELDNAMALIGRLNDLSNDRAGEAVQQLLEEMEERPLWVERIVTYRVTLGTGGPACGVDFNQNGTGRVWWQASGTPRIYAGSSLENGEALATTWGVDLMIEEDDAR